MIVSDRECLAYVTGSLEPGRQAEIEAALRNDPLLRRRMEALEAEVHAYWAAEPTPANTTHHFRVDVTPARAMRAGLVEARLTIGDGIDGALVVMARERTGWRRIWPTGHPKRLAEMQADTGTVRLRLDPGDAQALRFVVTPSDADVPTSDADLERLLREVRATVVHLVRRGNAWV
ncbi:MAG: hypothetical protein KC656_25500 [Myxococcales bacterium]|nr:hypothetical protein [Myxococcales bacterium]MCB9694251.1 hypothetical protein [Alphaproteobacteria bacterium]